MSGDLMNTREVAQYLGVHEKQVYALIKSKRIPSTRVTGKWIFPRKLIDTWIEYKITHEVDPIRLRPHPYEFYLYYDA